MNRRETLAALAAVVVPLPAIAATDAQSPIDLDQSPVDVLVDIYKASGYRAEDLNQAAIGELRSICDETVLTIERQPAEWRSDMPVHIHFADGRVETWYPVEIN